MKRSRLLSMPRRKLEVLSFKQLLARLRRLQQCEESLVLSDRFSSDDSGQIEFKCSPEWIAAHQQVKRGLSHCEHGPKGAELAETRKARALWSGSFKKRAGK